MIKREPPRLRPIIVDDGIGHRTTSSRSVCTSSLQTTFFKRDSALELLLFVEVFRRLWWLAPYPAKSTSSLSKERVLSMSAQSKTLGFSAQLDTSPKAPTTHRAEFAFNRCLQTTSFRLADDTGVAQSSCARSESVVNWTLGSVRCHLA